MCVLSWIRNPIYGRSPWAKISIVTSWYLFYVGSRTLSNTIEADLIGIALSLYPWPSPKTSGLFNAYSADTIFQNIVFKLIHHTSYFQETIVILFGVL